MKNKVEILSPAGNFEVFKTAILAGADAIYCAGKSYGARAFAANFSDDELVTAINYAHQYGVKVFVTCNTIIFENEIEEVVDYLDFLYLHQCDGVIVQDLGLASIIKARYPDFCLHASTQINVQTVEDCQMLKKIGFDRVILGREVDLETIKKIKEKVNIEIEVFIHGALCMSYSGGCYFSSLMGGRSGNRGRCAQPCRKEYTFNNQKRFYLSPKDLCTIDNILEISKYCDSLKIEGRMKSKEYVYNVVTSYKNVLDNGYNNLNEKKYQMQIAFNRGYTKGFINNENNALITNCLSSNHQGVLVGEVIDSYKEQIRIKIINTLQINDSIRIVDKNYEDAIVCNAMYKINNGKKNSELVKIANKGDIISLKVHKQISIGSKVYLTKRECDYDSNLYSKRKVEITGEVSLKDEYLVLTISDGFNICEGKILTTISDKDNSERINEQIRKTGGTIYTFTTLKGEVCYRYLDIKEINNLRRQLLDDLTIKRINKYERKINDVYPCLPIKEMTNVYFEKSILGESKESLTKLGIDVSTDADLYLREKHENDKNCYLVLPRVTSKVYENEQVVFTNLGNLSKISSIYLNVANSYTVRLLEHLGVEKIGLSIELSKSDIYNLVNGYSEHYQRIPELEIMVYGYYQMMYMKHCFVNKELGYKNLHCQECKKNIYLNEVYPIYGDSECHLAILSKDVVNLTSKMEELRKIGIKHFLFDYTNYTNCVICENNNDENTNNNGSGYYGHYLKAID